MTRDDKLLSAAGALEDAFETVVLNPETLLDRLDRQRSQDRYEPVVLQGTELSEERLLARHQDAFVAALLNHGEGERAVDLRSVLRDALSDPSGSEVLVVRDGEGAILAGVVRRTTSEAVVVAVMRVRRVNRLTDVIARQLVFQQRKAAADHGVGQVVIKDPAPSAAVVRALALESFAPDGDRWTCEVRRGVVAAEGVLHGSDRAHGRGLRTYPLAGQGDRCRSQDLHGVDRAGMGRTPL